MGMKRLLVAVIIALGVVMAEEERTYKGVVRDVYGNMLLVYIVEYPKGECGGLVEVIVERAHSFKRGDGVEMIPDRSTCLEGVKAIRIRRANVKLPEVEDDDI